MPDGKLLSGVKQAMDAYADAARVWNFKVRWPTISRIDKREFGDLIDRYELPVDLSEKTNSDEAMQVMWQVATIHLENARLLRAQ